MDPTIVVALVGGIFTILASAGGVMSAALLRRSERGRRKAEIEAAALQAERARLDARTERMLDEYQEENSRLRLILASRERGCTGE